MNTNVHVTLRVPKELHDEIMNTNEHSTKNAKYLARLNAVDTKGPTVSQTNTDNKEILADIKAGVEAILDQLNG
tara:strand:+ start:82 stop:303 length:222 start_codon:yes stop_codon:yes gene_type:complete